MEGKGLGAERHLNPTAEQIRNERRAAFIGHEYHVGAGNDLEVFDHDMGRDAENRATAQLARIRFNYMSGVEGHAEVP